MISFFESQNLSIFAVETDHTISKNEIKKLPSDAENVGFHMAVLVKTIANNIHEKLTPEAMYYLPDESTSWDAWEEIKNNQNNIAVIPKAYITKNTPEDNSDALKPFFNITIPRVIKTNQQVVFV